MSAAAAPVPALDDWQAWARHVNPTLAGLLQWTQRDQRFVHALFFFNDTATTEIYTHVLNRGPSGVPSPADRLAGGRP